MTIKYDHDFVVLRFCVFTWGLGVRGHFGVYGAGCFLFCFFYGAGVMRLGEKTLVASLLHHRRYDNGYNLQLRGAKYPA